jgi:hypothetical protein
MDGLCPGRGWSMNRHTPHFIGAALAGTAPIRRRYFYQPTWAGQIGADAALRSGILKDISRLPLWGDVAKGPDHGEVAPVNILVLILLFGFVLLELISKPEKAMIDFPAWPGEN